MIGKQLFAIASDNRAYPFTVLPPPYKSLILWYGGNQFWESTVTASSDGKTLTIHHPGYTGPTDMYVLE
ncbi:TPA: hypothetical protein SMO81_002285 [Proteus mirabilis]|nr:hypothetical protein [Proteus mirabilis]